MAHMMSGRLGQVLLHATMVKALAAHSSVVPTRTLTPKHPCTTQHTQHAHTSVQVNIC